MDAVCHPLHPALPLLKNTKDFRTEVNLRRLRAINSRLLLQILLSHFHSREPQRCHNQAGFFICPGHHITHAELQIVCFSPSFAANYDFLVHALLIGCLFKEDV